MIKSKQEIIETVEQNYILLVTPLKLGSLRLNRWFGQNQYKKRVMRYLTQLRGGNSTSMGIIIAY